MPWRPSHPDEAPTLGWQVLEWTAAFLPSPADETQPLEYTDEQARLILRWYELDPDSGLFVYRRGILEQAKGWGKSPFAATLALAGFCGPVCFDGWDAKGQPVGVPWGTGQRPPPLVQIAAVSEDQTENTYGALFSMLTANQHRAAIALGIDDGRTRLYLKNAPGAKLEPVTAAFGSREGQRVTDAILDETHLWSRRNHGVKLASTIRRNAAKMGGRTMETTNAPVLGQKSVAEQSDPSKPETGVLHYAKRPKVQPQPDWSKAKLLSALAEAYGDARWIDPDRLIKEIADPANTWDDALRFWFNIRSAGTNRAVDPRVWDALGKPKDIPSGTYIGAGFDGSVSRDATFLRGCTADGHGFTIAKWVRPTGDEMVRWKEAHPGQEWKVDRKSVHDAVAQMFSTYRVGRFNCDPPKWWSEIQEWEGLYGEDVVVSLDTNSARKMAPAVDRWLTAIREGSYSHDDDPIAAEHVKAAHLQRVRLADVEDDGRTMYVLVRGEEDQGIDGAVADVLAVEAAGSMPPDPGPKGSYLNESRAVFINL